MTDRKPLYTNLSPASFRDVGFRVDVSDLTAGRRTQVHEYPQRDKPWVEDLGRATRELSFEAFVVGDDYVDQANALLAALEEAGPGTLVHPWFGTLTVNIKDPARVSFDAGLGRARFSLSFVESGELSFPAASSATQSASRIAADNLQSASVSGFARFFTVDGFQDFVTAAANGNLGDMLGIVSSSEIDKVLGLSNKLASTLSTAIALVSSPTSLGWKVMGVLGLSGVATSVAAWTNVARSLARVSVRASMATPAPSAIYTASRQQANTNAAAVYALGRQALIAQAVGISSLVGSASDSQAAAYDGLIGVRNDILAAIDAESLTATDDVYAALMDARGAVWADLTGRARDSARLVTMTPPETLPALVLAYDLYENAARDADIVARNAIRHPGFVPPAQIKVLTR